MEYKMHESCEKGIVDDMCLHCEYLYWGGKEEVYCKYAKNKADKDKTSMKQSVFPN